MRVHILSDLHLEFAPFQPNTVDADVMVMAGDVHTGANGIKWLLQTFRDKPVLYVLGNHEFYGQKLQKLIANIKEIAQGTNVHVLDNDQVEIGVSSRVVERRYGFTAIFTITRITRSAQPE